MSQRFFVSESIAGNRVAISGDEGHHLSRVMRSQPGDAVTLFDGSGAEFDARIATVGRSTVEVEIVARREVDREAPLAIALGVALPKGDRQRFLVEKAVELGVAGLVPLETERGVAQPTDSALERLRRAVIEASKQCGRNRLMEIAPATPANAYFDAAWPAKVGPMGSGVYFGQPGDSMENPSTEKDSRPLPRSAAIRLIAHPGGEPLSTALAEANPKASANNWPLTCLSNDANATSNLRPAIFLAVGPEGGFTDDEVSYAVAAGWRAVSLGPRILRVETAALALAARIAMEVVPT